MYCRSTDTSKQKFAQYFDEICALNPDSIAIITGTHRFSYQQLKNAAVQVQSILKDVGVRQSQIVAICIPRSAALVAAMLGCILHGAVFQLIDTSLPAQRVMLLLEITRPCVLLYTSHNHSNLEIVLTACTSILPLSVSVQYDQGGVYIKHQQELEGTPSNPIVSETFVCGNDVLYVIFTSGSTGSPKAVCVPVSGTLNRFEWMWKKYPFTSSDVACFKTSVNFADYIWEVFGALLKGIPLAVPLEQETKDPRLLSDIIKRLNVTRVTLVPSYIRYLLQYATASDSLRSLTHCISSGEPLSLSLAAMFLRALPSCRLLNLYGTSEISADITYFEVTPQYVEHSGNAFVPIGRPIANIKIDVIDPNTGDVISCDTSTPGELVTYGVCVANSYLNSDDKSLITTGLKSFNTHDLVHYNSSGDLMYIGRRDHQIKVRGVRINPSEIEAMLEKSSIVERAVVAADESHMNLIGFIQISESHNTTKDSSALVKYGGASFFKNTFLGGNIATDLLKLLPQYLVPSLYFFTHRLPTLPSGKVNRKELPPLSDIRMLLSESTNETEQLSKTEEQLCSIIKNILQLNSVSLAGHFFALGGNSLSAIELASGIEESFHCKLSVSTIISSPTIQSLAVAIDSEIARNVTVPSYNHSHTDSSTGPVTYGQEGIISFEGIAGSVLYVVDIAAKCLQSISADYLQESIRWLAMNHESLRTLFPCTLDGQPFQKVLSPDSAEFLSIAASTYSIVDCSKESPLRFIDGQISLPKLRSDFSKGPLWKFTLFTNVTVPGETDLCSIFAFQAHHIMTDGWSMQLLLTDLENIYMKYINGRSNENQKLYPAKPFYGIKHAIHERGLVYNKQLVFWESKLRNSALPIFLHPKCIPTEKCGAFSIHRMFKTPLEHIRGFCQANSITEFVFTLTSMLVAVYALNGTQEFVVFTPNANRDAESMKVTGFYDNCLPVRAEVDSMITLQSLLQNVKAYTLEMMENQIPLSPIEAKLLKQGKICPNNVVSSGMFEQVLFTCDYKYSTPFLNSVLFKNFPTLYASCDFHMELYTTIATEHMEVHAVYEDALYDKSTVQLLLKTWESVIETMVKHVHMNVPMRLLCQNFHIPTCTGICEEHTWTFESSNLESQISSAAISLNNNTVTWQQLSSIQYALSCLASAMSGSHPTVITSLSLSAHKIAIVTEATKLNYGVSLFSSMAEIVHMLTTDPVSPCIVITQSTEDQECILRSIPTIKQHLVSIDTIDSLLRPNSIDPQPGVGKTYPAGSVKIQYDERTVKSKWTSDIKMCSRLATKYFSEVRGAVVLMSNEASTLPIATSLLLHGIRVEAFTYECLDVFIQLISNSRADLLVISEITVPSILPKIVGCNNIKHLWIQGLPLGLAYISKWMTASQHVQVIVTHSLVHEQHLITHHLNLKDVPSIEDGSIPCIPIGNMCHGLNGKVLHRDGRDVCQGFVGSFATMDDGQIYRSTSLVRQLPKDGSYELVSVDAEAYYKGIDVTPALCVLSTIPEVTWCGVSTSTAKDSTIVLYTTNVNSSRNEIRERLLDCLSLSYLSIIYPLAVNPPITPDFKPNLGGLSFAKQDSLLGPSMFAAHKDDEDVDKVVKAVSKAFGTDPETVWQTSDLLAVGGMSCTNILALTIILNTEFRGGYSISDVYQAVRGGLLVELVRTRTQGTF